MITKLVLLCASVCFMQIKKNVYKKSPECLGPQNIHRIQSGSNYLEEYPFLFFAQGNLASLQRLLPARKGLRTKTVATPLTIRYFACFVYEG